MSFRREWRYRDCRVCGGYGFTDEPDEKTGKTECRYCDGSGLERYDAREEEEDEDAYHKIHDPDFER